MLMLINLDSFQFLGSISALKESDLSLPELFSSIFFKHFWNNNTLSKIINFESKAMFDSKIFRLEHHFIDFKLIVKVQLNDSKIKGG